MKHANQKQLVGEFSAPGQVKVEKLTKEAKREQEGKSNMKSKTAKKETNSQQSWQGESEINAKQERTSTKEMKVHTSSHKAESGRKRTRSRSSDTRVLKKHRPVDGTASGSYRSKNPGQKCFVKL